MAQLRIFESESSSFAESSPDRAASDGEGTVQYRFHHSGEDTLNLFEVKVPPDYQALPHAHGVDEIIAVVEGELHFGSQVLRSGSSVLIPGHTLYGFRAGPEGSRFLNFRATADGLTMSQKEFGVWRRQQHREP